MASKSNKYLRDIRNSYCYASYVKYGSHPYYFAAFKTADQNYIMNQKPCIFGFMELIK